MAGKTVFANIDLLKNIYKWNWDWENKKELGNYYFGSLPSVEKLLNQSWMPTGAVYKRMVIHKDYVSLILTSENELNSDPDYKYKTMIDPFAYEFYSWPYCWDWCFYDDFEILLDIKNTPQNRAKSRSLGISQTFEELLEMTNTLLYIQSIFQQACFSGHIHLVESLYNNFYQKYLVCPYSCTSSPILSIVTVTHKHLEVAKFLYNKNFPFLDNTNGYYLRSTVDLGDFSISEMMMNRFVSFYDYYYRFTNRHYTRHKIYHTRLAHDFSEPGIYTACKPDNALMLEYLFKHMYSKILFPRSRIQSANIDFHHYRYYLDFAVKNNAVNCVKFLLTIMTQDFTERPLVPNAFGSRSNEEYLKNHLTEFVVDAMIHKSFDVVLYLLMHGPGDFTTSDDSGVLFRHRIHSSFPVQVYFVMLARVYGNAEFCSRVCSLVFPDINNHTGTWDKDLGLASMERYFSYLAFFGYGDILERCERWRNDPEAIHVTNEALLKNMDCTYLSFFKKVCFTRPLGYTLKKFCFNEEHLNLQRLVLDYKDKMFDRSGSTGKFKPLQRHSQKKMQKIDNNKTDDAIQYTDDYENYIARDLKRDHDSGNIDINSDNQDANSFKHQLETLGSTNFFIVFHSLVFDYCFTQQCYCLDYLNLVLNKEWEKFKLFCTSNSIGLLSFEERDYCSYLLENKQPNTSPKVLLYYATRPSKMHLKYFLLCPLEALQWTLKGRRGLNYKERIFSFLYYHETKVVKNFFLKLITQDDNSSNYWSRLTTRSIRRLCRYLCVDLGRGNRHNREIILEKLFICFQSNEGYNRYNV